MRYQQAVLTVLLVLWGTGTQLRVRIGVATTDAPYTEQPIGFDEFDSRDLQITRMMASVSSWRESGWEDLLDEIAEDVSQLDNDDLGAI